jgi:hypothetical protein
VLLFCSSLWISRPWFEPSFSVVSYSCAQDFVCICLSFQCNVQILTLTILTLWSWVPLERPQVVQPLGRFPAFYGTRRFITESTIALHLYQVFILPYSKCWICPPAACIQALARRLIPTWRRSQDTGVLCIVSKSDTIRFRRVSKSSTGGKYIKDFELLY